MRSRRRARPRRAPPRRTQETSAWSVVPLRFLLELVERQKREDTLAVLAIEDDLVGAAEHPFHGLEEDALARDIGRLLVLVVDLDEAGCLAGRLGDGLLLVALRALQDALRFAAGFGNDTVGVGRG